jgi:hypothetical protein
MGIAPVGIATLGIATLGIAIVGGDLLVQAPWPRKICDSISIKDGGGSAAASQMQLKQEYGRH